MAFIRGPNIVTNGLVLYLDAANRKSCTGQPVTNLLTYTNTLTTDWSGYCGPTSNITYNTTDVTDPLGTNTAIKVVRGSNVTCNNTEAWGLLYSVFPSVILSSGKGYTVTVYARGASGGETIDFGLNDSHMTYSQTLTTTWTRYTYYISSVSDTSRGMQFRNTTGNCTYYIWGPQVVLGTVAGDYVASVGTTNGTKNLTFRDLSGNNNNGTFTNAPVFSSNNNGNIVFDGVDDYISTGFTTTNLSTSSDFTWLMWCYLSATSAGPQVQVYFGNFTNYSPNYDWWGAYRNGTTLYIGNYASSTERTISTTIPSAGWYQIGQVRNGSTHYLYLNGVSKNSGTFTTPSINSAATLRLGSVGNGATNADNFNGNIASFQLYNRALSASEVLQNFNATKTRFGL